MVSLHTIARARCQGDTCQHHLLRCVCQMSPLSSDTVPTLHTGLWKEAAMQPPPESWGVATPPQGLSVYMGYLESSAGRFVSPPPPLLIIHLFLWTHISGYNPREALIPQIVPTLVMRRPCGPGVPLTYPIIVRFGLVSLNTFWHQKILWTHLCISCLPPRISHFSKKLRSGCWLSGIKILCSSEFILI